MALSKQEHETKKVFIKDPSLEELQENGFDPSGKESIEDDVIAKLSISQYMRVLTRRQQQVAICLWFEGLKREETALKLVCSVQSINQIVIRIRKRLKKNGIMYKAYKRRTRGRSVLLHADKRSEYNWEEDIRSLDKNGVVYGI